MKHALVKEICEFLLDNVEELHFWPQELLTEWVRYCVKHKRIIDVRNADDEIAGVGAARCLSQDTPDADWYSHDENGDTIYVDLVAVTEPSVMVILWDAMKRRYRAKENVAFRRLRDGKKRAFKLESFEKNLARHG